MRTSEIEYKTQKLVTPEQSQNRMIKQNVNEERRKAREWKKKPFRTSDRDPCRHFLSSSERERLQPKMKIPFVPCAVIIVITSAVSSNPVARDRVQSKFFFDSFPKGVTISRVTTEDHTPQPAPSYSIRFVPLITLLAGLFPNFISKLGQFTGVNKYVNTRRFDLAAPAQQNMTASMEEEDDVSSEEDEFESELIECDSAHLGLWPDKTDSQRYYKCEIDPRTPATATCIKDLFQGKHLDKTDMPPLEKIEVPGVKPCFLLSMMKCANGFKYQHKTRICVPDIVFATHT